MALLSPKHNTRITALHGLIERFGPAAPNFQEILKSIESREANRHELSAIFDESTKGVAALQVSLIQKIKCGFGFSVEDVVPQSISYFERFCGPEPDTRGPESYFQEVLIPYRKALLSRNLEIGIDICCLGALRDDLTPGQWVAAIDDDVIWETLSSSHAESNPFSLLGVLDIALYRQADHRFQEFSAEVVANLLEERHGQQDGADIYRLLPVFANLVLNRINLRQTGSNYPAYWKRMCAWMQAGLIARALLGSSFPIDIDALQQRAHDNMVAAGAYAGLVDARKEPMLFVDRITPQVLRSEILGRLHILKSRHESEGRQVPRSQDIDHALSQTLAVAYSPGLLEGHIRPTKPVPQEVTEKLEDASTDSAMAFSLQPLVMASQLFALGKPELESALQAVRMVTETNSDTKPRENLKLLELASIIAAANRDTMLTDEIADAVVRVSSKITEEEDIQIMLRIILQTAAAYEEHNAWFKWLEERLATIALHLPPPPNECLRTYLEHLEAIGTVLPIDSWVHIRAQSIASSGAA